MTKTPVKLDFFDKVCYNGIMAYISIHVVKKNKAKNRGRKIIIASVYILMILAVLKLTLLRIFTTNIVFNLVGDPEINLEYGENYEEPGFSATMLGYDLSEKVQIEGNINPEKIGAYELKYNFEFLTERKTLSRIVKISDHIAPEITLNGESEIAIFVGDEYNDDGATARDNYDGDLSEQIITEGDVDINTPGEYQIIYRIQDSSENAAEISRKVIVKKKPIIVPRIPRAVNLEPISADEITSYIQSKGYNISVGYVNLATGATYFYNPGELYYGASLIKSLVGAYFYENGLVTTPEIRENIKKSITVSDNAAHLALIDYAGRENIKNYGLSLGAPHTLGYGSYGDTTVADQIAYQRKIYAVASAYPELRSFLINNNNNNIAPAGLSAIHKYGSYEEYYHDAGIVLDSQPYILVVLTRHSGATGRAVIRDVAGLIYRLNHS